MCLSLFSSSSPHSPRSAVLLRLSSRPSLSLSATAITGNPHTHTHAHTHIEGKGETQACTNKSKKCAHRGEGVFELRDKLVYSVTWLRAPLGRQARRPFHGYVAYTIRVEQSSELRSDLYDRGAAVDDNGFTNDLDLVFVLRLNQSFNFMQGFSSRRFSSHT